MYACMYVCIQEGEESQADRYAELALQSDRYNPAGLSVCVCVWSVYGVLWGSVCLS